MPVELTQDSSGSDQTQKPHDVSDDKLVEGDTVADDKKTEDSGVVCP